MTIAEVGRQYGLSVDTLRYYERIGLIPPVGRTSGGIRSYTESDCSWVELIKCMRSSGIPVEALIEYVALFQQGDETAPARKQLLMEQRDLLAKRIEEQKRTLERLDKKIERYESMCLPMEQQMRAQRAEAEQEKSSQPA